MKRGYYIAALLFMLAAMFALPAHAGVFDGIKTFISEQAMTVLITGIIAILGAFGMGYKLWGIAAKELFEFAKAIFSAVDADGPDGRKINDAEMERIIKEGQELYPAVAKALAASKKK
jgi:predicted negative regulator of RcsB-dependent stress response